MSGQFTNDEKYTPRVQGGKYLPDLKSLMDGSFYVVHNKDVEDVYLNFGRKFTKLNLNKYDTLEVDTIITHNLFADKFTLRQTSFQNGDLMVSDGGVIDVVNGNELTFKDQSGFNVCAFVVGDLIEAHSVRADNSLAITNPQGTVTGVVGNKVTITYYSTSAFKKGDEVYRVGNTTDATRQDSLYFSTNRTNTPYFDVYDNINSFDTVGSPTTAWITAKPKVRIGNLAGITDSDFGGALTGYGIYTQKGYFKGDIKITNQGSISIAGFNNDAGFITSGDIPPIPHTFYQSATPTTMITGDFWFDTTAGVMRMKRYNGTTWDAVSVYMDTNGIYAGNITAGQITTGSLAGQTLTGGTIQTASTGQRVVLGGAALNFYDTGDSFCGGIAGAFGRIYVPNANVTGSFNTSDSQPSVAITYTDPAKISIYGVAAGTGASIAGVSTHSGTETALSFSAYAAEFNCGVSASDFSVGGLYPVATQDWVNTNYDTFPGFGTLSGDYGFTDNSTNWNTAYGWGNHASAGYVTGTPWTSMGYVTGTPWTSAGYLTSSSGLTSTMVDAVDDQIQSYSYATEAWVTLNFVHK